MARTAISHPLALRTSVAWEFSMPSPVCHLGALNTNLLSMQIQTRCPQQGCRLRGRSIRRSSAALSEALILDKGLCIFRNTSPVVRFVAWPLMGQINRRTPLAKRNTPAKAHGACNAHLSRSTS